VVLVSVHDVVGELTANSFTVGAVLGQKAITIKLQVFFFLMMSAHIWINLFFQTADDQYCLYLLDPSSPYLLFDLELLFRYKSARLQICYHRQRLDVVRFFPK